MTALKKFVEAINSAIPSYEKDYSEGAIPFFTYREENYGSEIGVGEIIENRDLCICFLPQGDDYVLFSATGIAEKLTPVISKRFPQDMILENLMELEYYLMDTVEKVEAYA